MASLTAVNFSNPLLLLALSYVFGALFGLLSSKLAGALAKK